MAYIPGRKSHRRKEREKEPESPRRRGEQAPDVLPTSDLDLVKLKQAHEALENTHHTLRETQSEMIFRFAIAAEYKDADTGGHILRISDYSVELARAIHMPEEQVAELRYASPMHDIGKIGIPDSILQKPGKLTPEEWEIMKQHTLIGSKIFDGSQSPLLKAAAQIALTHHEKFDGSGYPRGLKGENIPIFGRIVAIVDVFDAIVSERCYKKASTFAEGMEYIASLGGTHLDPVLVKRFVGLEERIEDIYRANHTIQEFIKDGLM